jgi:hypothetical protein
MEFILKFGVYLPHSLQRYSTDLNYFEESAQAFRRQSLLQSGAFFFVRHVNHNTIDLAGRLIPGSATRALHYISNSADRNHGYDKEDSDEPHTLFHYELRHRTTFPAMHRVGCQLGTPGEKVRADYEHLVFSFRPLWELKKLLRYLIVSGRNSDWVYVQWFSYRGEAEPSSFQGKSGSLNSCAVVSAISGCSANGVPDAFSKRSRSSRLEGTLTKCRA